jgi:hypothetical protein
VHLRLVCRWNDDDRRWLPIMPIPGHGQGAPATGEYLLGAPCTRKLRLDAMQNDVAAYRALASAVDSQIRQRFNHLRCCRGGHPQKLWPRRLLLVHRCSTSWCQWYLSTPEQECSGQGLWDLCCVGRLLLLFLCKFHPALYCIELVV